MFIIPQDAITIEEGEDFSLAFTHTTPLASDTTIRWTITPIGFLPARSSDFEAFTGTLDLTAGSDSFTLNIPSVDDSLRGPSQREFRLDLYEVRDGQDDLAIGSVDGFIDDNNRSSGISARPLSIDGGDEDDYYIFTAYTSGNGFLHDNEGVNTIVFDGGVEIVRVYEDWINYDTDTFDRFTLQDLIDQDLIPEGSTTKTGFPTIYANLSTGNFISWRPGTSGATYKYRLGDSEDLTHLEFREALGLPVRDAQNPAVQSDGSASATIFEQPVTVNSYVDLSTFDLANHTPSTASHNFRVTNGDDFLYLGGDVNYTANGERGDDYIVINRFLHGDATINDREGVNTIKLDAGVTITNVSETLRNHDFHQLLLTLNTGAEVTVQNPAGSSYEYQIGNGEVLTYLEFRQALGLPEVDLSTLQADTLVTDLSAQPFSVPFPIGEYDLSASDITITEGEDISLAFTHRSPLVADATIRWVITPTGSLSARSSDFNALTGTLALSAGERNFTLTIPSLDDSVYGSSQREFRLDLYAVREGQNDLAIGSINGFINDNDERPDSRTYLLANDGNKNIFSLGTIYDTSIDGGFGDDHYVVTSHTHGDIRINDFLGTNTIIFDGGVEITKVSEIFDNFSNPPFDDLTLEEVIETGFLPEGSTSRTVFVKTTITLSTGAEITWTRLEDDFYNYRIGDSDELTYLEFREALGLPDAGEYTLPLGTPLVSDFSAQPLTIDTYVDVSNLDVAGNRPSTLSYDFRATDGDDILYLGANIGHNANGGAGDDHYIISRFLQTDVTIADTLGANTIKLDAGVRITSVSESLRNPNHPDFEQLTLRELIDQGLINATFTLSTGARVTWAPSASNSYQYQVGDDDILTYLELREALGLPVADTSTLPAGETALVTDLSTQPFSVPFPVIIPPVVIPPVVTPPVGDRIVLTDVRTHVEQSEAQDDVHLATIALQQGDISEYTLSVKYSYAVEIIEDNGEYKLIAKGGDYYVSSGWGGQITATKGDTELTQGFDVEVVADIGTTYLRWVNDGDVLELETGRELTVSGKSGLLRFKTDDNGDEIYVPWEGDFLLGSVSFLRFLQPGTDRLSPRDQERLAGDDVLHLDSNLPELPTGRSRWDIGLRGGNDVYRIEQGLSRDVSIGDGLEVNFIVFAENTEVTAVTGGILTIDTDTTNQDTTDTVTLRISSPDRFFLYMDENEADPTIENFETFFADLL